MLCFIDRYKDLVPDIMATPATRVTSLMTKAEFDQVNDLFIEAAQIAPDGNIDADVQVIFRQGNTI